MPVTHRTAIVLLLTLLLGVLAVVSSSAVQAVVFVFKDQSRQTLSIKVGGGGKSISRVNFDVPAAAIGNGAPIGGDTRIKFTLIIRSSAANPLTGILTVNSATPLDNGSGGTIPLTDISWAADDGDIPSGSYAGISSQLLATFVSSARIRDRHTFSFSNQNIYDAGIYNGQVTYTWAAP